jgi:hypothetical protein
MIALASGFAAGLPEARGDDPEGVAFFEAKVRPVLEQHCYKCHSGRSAKPKAGLRLDTREAALKGGLSGPAIEPGNPDESLLIQAVELAEGIAPMPPDRPLPDAVVADLRRWVSNGAVDPRTAAEAPAQDEKQSDGRDWWSLQPPARPTVPPADPRLADRVRSPIDAFVFQTLAENGLAPAPEADRRTLIRRLSFDLLGLPPAPEEVESFLGDDRPDAYERLVDRLLDSPQYGVRWGRAWLDLARFGESNGFEHDEFRPNAWPYRDWVVDALNRDLPYDEFARMQLAGDALRPDDPRAIEATGFLVAGAYDSVGQTQQSEAMRRVVRQDEMEDVIGTVGQSFLGLTIHCARCHDHKFDPIAQVEYYRLASALAGVRHGERDLTPLDPDVRAARRAVADLLDRVAAIEAPARERIRGAAVAVEAPSPIGRWDFEKGAGDPLGGLDGSLRGEAKLVPEGLQVDGKSGFVATAPLASDLEAKTLEAWVRLDDLEQRGGAAIGVQVPDGAFDAIVFGEVEPRRWMAGSEGFARSRSFGGPEEAEADRRPVHVAITYAEDGTIAAYRDGQPYGVPYKTSPPTRFPAGQSQVLFGLRHMPPGGNRMLAGVVLRARLYDRALRPDEVAASAAAGRPLSEEALAEALPLDRRAERARLLAEVASRRAAIASRDRKAYAVAPRLPEPTHRLVRGNPAQPAEVVSAGGVSALAGLDAEFGLAPDAPEAERRVRLATWITDPRNPLFARVMANRLWQAHFGAGLVETPSDFGLNGGRPSHPELLDWLAVELADRGWSLKRMHRLIVTSSTYRQSSRPDADAAKVDASGRLLWRKAPVRLEAEMVRDAMLAVSGTLDPALGGPGFREFAVVKAEGTISHLYPPAESPGPGSDRRTLFRTWARGGRSGFLDAFDCPDPSTTAPRRAVTTTPIQALTLLNDALTFRLADRFAERLRREAGDDSTRQVARAYRLAFGRDPGPDELDRARRVVERFGPGVLARAIFNSNEFLYVE